MLESTAAHQRIWAGKGNMGYRGRLHSFGDSRRLGLTAHTRVHRVHRVHRRFSRIPDAFRVQTLKISRESHSSPNNCCSISHEHKCAVTFSHISTGIAWPLLGFSITGRAKIVRYTIQPLHTKEFERLMTFHKGLKPSKYRSTVVLDKQIFSQ